MAFGCRSSIVVYRGRERERDTQVHQPFHLESTKRNLCGLSRKGCRRTRIMHLFLRPTSTATCRVLTPSFVRSPSDLCSLETRRISQQTCGRRCVCSRATPTCCVGAFFLGVHTHMYTRDALVGEYDVFVLAAKSCLHSSAVSACCS